MARTKKGTPPSYRKASYGRARVTIDGKDILLGEYGSPESHEEYERVIAEWRAAHPQAGMDVSPHRDMRVDELVLAYTKHAQTYYRKAGKETSEVSCIKYALGLLVEIAGDDRTRAFGPRRLTEVRDAMVTRRNWARKNANKMLVRIKSMFKWAVSEEYISSDGYSALLSVPGFGKGRATKNGQIPRETSRVKSVDWATVEATLPFLPQVQQDMVRLQHLGNMRPEEVCGIRPADVDRSGETWLYRPAPDANKTDHHELTRIVPLGPQARAILGPYLKRPPMSYCFSPREAVAQRAAKSPKGVHRRQDQKATSRKTARCVMNCYTTASYRRAIARAAKVANDAAIEKAREEATKQGKVFEVTGRLVKHWHPHQIRHTRTTEIANSFTVDEAQAFSGHQDARTTQIYIDEMTRKAAQVAEKVG